MGRTAPPVVACPRRSQSVAVRGTPGRYEGRSGAFHPPRKNTTVQQPMPIFSRHTATETPGQHGIVERLLVTDCRATVSWMPDDDTLGPFSGLDRLSAIRFDLEQIEKVVVLSRPRCSMLGQLPRAAMWYTRGYRVQRSTTSTFLPPLPAIDEPKRRPHPIVL